MSSHWLCGVQAAYNELGWVRREVGTAAEAWWWGFSAWAVCRFWTVFWTLLIFIPRSASHFSLLIFFLQFFLFSFISIPWVSGKMIFLKEKLPLCGMSKLKQDLIIFPFSFIFYSFQFFVDNFKLVLHVSYLFQYLNMSMLILLLFD